MFENWKYSNLITTKRTWNASFHGHLGLNAHNHTPWVKTNMAYCHDFQTKFTYEIAWIETIPFVGMYNRLPLPIIPSMNVDGFAFLLKQPTKWVEPKSLLFQITVPKPCIKSVKQWCCMHTCIIDSSLRSSWIMFQECIEIHWLTNTVFTVPCLSNCP